MQGLIVVTSKIQVMNIFYYPKPLSVKVFVLFACIEVLQAIADYYLGFDKSVIDFQNSFSAYLPNPLLATLYLVNVIMNIIFDAAQMYYIVLIRNNLMRIVYLLGNVAVFYTFFSDTNKVMKAFNSTDSNEVILGTLGFIALVCAIVTSLCLTRNDFIEWMRHREVQI